MKVQKGQTTPLFDKLDQILIQNHLLTALDGSTHLDIEREILKNLILPGTNRVGMPQNPIKSNPQRKAEINEITTFSTIGSEQIQRALILKEFAELMKEKEQERDWKFYDRNFCKELTKDAVKYEFSRAFFLNPNVATKYNEREDGLLVSLYFKNPPGRIMRNQWSHNFENATEFRNFLTKYGKLFS